MFSELLMETTALICYATEQLRLRLVGRRLNHGDDNIFAEFSLDTRGQENKEETLTAARPHVTPQPNYIKKQQRPFNEPAAE